MAGKEKDGDDEEVKFVAVGEGADIADEDHPVDDKKKVREREELEDDEDDEADEPTTDRRLGAAEEGGEGEDERKRSARRDERRERKRRQREAQRRDQIELNYLRNRNETLEKRFSTLESRVENTEVASIEQEIKRLKNLQRTADRALADAVTAGKGDEVAEATRLRDDIRDGIAKAETRKEAQARARKERDEEGGDEEQQTNGGPDQRTVSLIKDWHSRHSWYDFNRRDEDSAIVGVIDAGVAADGFRPNTQEYYDELEDRMREHKLLKHRFKSGGRSRDNEDDEVEERSSRRNGRDREEREETPQKRRARGPQFRVRVGGQEKVVGEGETFVTKERRQAMEDAGVWDDPKLRNKMLKRYAEYDRDSAKNRS